MVDRRDKLALGQAYGVPAADPALGSVPGVRFWRKDEMSDRQKAPENGTYTMPGGGRFKIRAGDPLPPGAVFASTADQVEQVPGGVTGADLAPIPGTIRVGTTPDGTPILVSPGVELEASTKAVEAAKVEWERDVEARIAAAAEAAKAEAEKDVEGRITEASTKAVEAAKVEWEKAAKAKAKVGSGPSETTQGAGPSETSSG